MSDFFLREIVLAGAYDWFCAGSLPHLSPEPAVAWILERENIVPFWPELPQRGASERMIDRSLRASRPEWDGYREEEAGGLFALVRMLDFKGRKLPLLKAQVLGPLSYLTYAERSETCTPARLQQACQVCMRQVEFQLELLGRRAARVLVVIDDPALLCR